MAAQLLPHGANPLQLHLPAPPPLPLVDAFSACAGLPAGAPSLPWSAPKAPAPPPCRAQARPPGSLVPNLFFLAWTQQGWRRNFSWRFSPAGPAPLHRAELGVLAMVDARRPSSIPPAMCCCAVHRSCLLCARRNAQQTLRRRFPTAAPLFALHRRQTSLLFPPPQDQHPCSSPSPLDPPLHSAVVVPAYAQSKSLQQASPSIAPQQHAPSPRAWVLDESQQRATPSGFASVFHVQRRVRLRVTCAATPTEV
jgi:hypothetical protein